jgi:plastocyanin
VREKATMKFAVVVAFLVVFAALGVEAGEIEGEVVIESGVSSRAKNSNPDRKASAKKYGLKSLKKEAKLGGLPRDEVVDERSFVLVYLAKEKDGAKLKATPRSVEITQEKRRFFAHVTAMPVGSTVKFTNRDKFYHHIYSPNSSALSVPEHRGEVTRKLGSVGKYELFCDIHPLMNAYLYVVPNDKFVVAKGGKFSLKGVPPGNYVLKAWHPRLKAKSYDVKVGDGKSAVKVTL